MQSVTSYLLCVIFGSFGWHYLFREYEDSLPYMLLVSKRIDLGISLYVNVSTVFQFFQDCPMIVTDLLFLVMVIAICVSDLKGKSRGIGYMSMGSLICLGIPWCVSDLPVLGVTSLSATILLAEGSFTYRREKRREEMENRCLSLICEKGQVTLEDVMIWLRLPLVEAEDILYDLWDRGLLEKREGRKNNLQHCIKGKQLKRGEGLYPIFSVSIFAMRFFPLLPSR